jgi:protein SCO1/2
MRRRAILALPGALALPRPALAAALPDARITDHRGRRRRFVSEVIGARVVALDFVLTGCATLCHLVSAAMSEAEALLEPRLGPRGAGLVSIGLDPIGDTPRELARYAERYEAGPNWSFVAMPHAALDQVLRRLGGPEPGGEHAPMVLVLDAGGVLRRLSGVPEPEAIAGAVQAALAARGRS